MNLADSNRPQRREKHSAAKRQPKAPDTKPQTRRTRRRKAATEGDTKEARSRTVTSARKGPKTDYDYDDEDEDDYEEKEVEEEEEYERGQKSPQAASKLERCSRQCESADDAGGGRSFVLGLQEASMSLKWIAQRLQMGSWI